EVATGKVRPVLQKHASLRGTLCPLGQSKKAIRPRASDRTMHCHSSSGQSYRLVVSENDGRRHNSEMEPQGRTIASPSRTRRQSKTLCLEKTALRVRNYVQTVGLNAETKKDRHRAAGEIICLDIPPVWRRIRH